MRRAQGWKTNCAHMVRSPVVLDTILALIEGKAA